MHNKQPTIPNSIRAKPPIKTTEPPSNIIKNTKIIQARYVMPVKAYNYTISQVMSAGMGLCMFLGGILLLSGAAITLSDFQYYYRAAGVLWIITFSFFTAGSVFGIVSSAALGLKNNRSSYQIINGIASILFAIGSIVMIVGSGLWPVGSFKYLSAAGINFIIGSSAMFCSFCLRNYAAVTDGLDVYHNYMKRLTAPRTEPTGLITYEVAPKDQIAGLYLNGIVCCFYSVAGILLLIGSICWILFLFTSQTYSFQVEAGVLWVLSGSLFSIGSLFQIMSRR
ncbi:hypothetical protein AKO1_015194 [Acrasis kona]|uniref:YrhK domain-containing protein n=1 Tax=Acrasis kona TaxID=1008807 RepID=A0AAW2ZFZ5_9EUKA